MIVGICGPIRGGKSSTCKFLTEKCQGYKAYSFADALKEECAKHMDRVELGWTGTDWTGPKTEKGRQFLCDFADEQRAKNPDIWLNIVKDKIKNDGTQFAVIQDARYINELNWIADRGLVVHVQNDRAEANFIDEVQRKGCKSINPSEIEWRFWLLANTHRHLTLFNNDTLEHLERMVTGYLDKEIKRDPSNWD